MSKKDIENQTALHAAAKKLNLTELQSLLETKINPDIKDPKGALHSIWSFQKLGLPEQNDACRLPACYCDLKLMLIHLPKMATRH